MAIVLAPILLAAQKLILSYVAGYVMKGIINVVKIYLPKVWEKIPEAVRPFVSAALGTAAGIVAGDPSMLVADAVAGAAGGATAKVSHDAEKPKEEPSI